MLTDLFVYIIPIIVGLIIFNMFFKDFRDTIHNISSLISTSIFFAIVSASITFSISAVIIYGMILTNFIPKMSTTYAQNIVSLKDNNQISGSFVLGTGNIGRTQYYIFYQKLSDGGLKKRQICDNVTIYENDEEIPRYEWTEEHDFSNTKLFKLSIFNHFGILKKYDKKLFVPEGTIIKEFKLE